jgi:hypothetical protein
VEGGKIKDKELLIILVENTIHFLYMVELAWGKHI